MAVRPLCVEPHPLLRKPARPVEQFSDDLRRLVRDLVDTMYANDGIGLAAPQIGQPLQVLVASPSQHRGREVILVNPVLRVSKGRAGIVEGCLSVPKLWERVRRAARVTLSGFNPVGQRIEVDADGLLAIVLQHEFDHLQGRLVIGRLSWFRRLRAMRKLRPASRMSAAPALAVR